ncbi:MAG: carboxypeptidase-like regulatory domain-containing protein, partial [Candidatus Nealsonbacteria bacterium]|nr:carboxypeptidase-like regulatory domain-containing protein [Candidatus Nealsonbacteria bacterium]
NRTVAGSIAMGELEQIKNTSYQLLGTVGGYPSGSIAPSATETINNVNYTVETKIDYVIDPKDGIAAPEDECPNDYKKVEIKISWQKPFGGSILFGTNITPPNLPQECAEIGGVLSVSVFNFKGEMIFSPLIEIKDSLTGDMVKSASPDSGQFYFSLPAGVYKIFVSKSGYSSDRTYSISEIAVPENPDPAVINDKVEERGFSIDKLSNLTVKTLVSWVISDFTDSFIDNSKIESSSNITISGGKAGLEFAEGKYSPSGILISKTIEPASLLRWEALGWEQELQENTSIKYHLLYSSDGENWSLIPDSDLSGNSVGFSDSPIDLSSLSISNYNKLRIKADFSTSDLNITPYILDWYISWRSSGGTPVSNILVNIHGKKKIGTDAAENPVYKYDSDKTSDTGGNINLSSIDSDSYYFSIKSVGLNLKSTEPSSQPVTLNPDSSLNVNLYVESQNSFLAKIKDSSTGNPIFSASVRLHKSGYDITQYTDSAGQTYFVPLNFGDYTADVKAVGYHSQSVSVSVSGGKIQIIQLLPEE